jgi:hypothetical protein
MSEMIIVTVVTPRDMCDICNQRTHAKCALTKCNPLPRFTVVTLCDACDRFPETGNGTSNRPQTCMGMKQMTS